MNTLEVVYGSEHDRGSRRSCCWLRRGRVWKAHTDAEEFGRWFVLLSVTDSGFERIPLARRAKAFTAKEGGWTMVITLIQKHLAETA